MNPAITFRNPGPWGLGKRGDLDAEEIDQNFYNLAQAVGDLLANPIEPVQIAAFSLVGVGMLITMSNGTTVGPLPLPVLSWRWRDAWQPFVPYKALDVFKIEGNGIFLALQDHTSAATFDENATQSDNPLYQKLFAVNSPSRSGGISAAGTDQSTATQLVDDWNIISTVTAGQGVALRSASVEGFPQWVFNAGANPLLTYPKDGDGAAINAQAVDAPFTIEPDSGVEFRPYSLTQWYSST